MEPIFNQLRHVAALAAQPRQREAARVGAVPAHLAVVRVVQPREQLEQQRQSANTVVPVSNEADELN